MPSIIVCLACRWYNDHTLLDPYAPLVSGRHNFGVRDDFENFEQQVLISYTRQPLVNLWPHVSAHCHEFTVCHEPIRIIVAM